MEYNVKRTTKINFRIETSVSTLRKQIIFEKIIVSTSYIFKKLSLKILVTIIRLFLVSKALIQQIIAFRIFENLCKEESKTPYAKFRELVAEACNVDLSRGWVLKPRNNKEVN